MKIKFTNVTPHEHMLEPIPAAKLLPDWYKKMDSYVYGDKVPRGDGVASGTIKRCVPVFDSITAGYLILLPADVYVSQKEDGPFYEWANFGLIEFHAFIQAPEHPGRKGIPLYPKFMNPWSIKTPKGYSTFFTQPMHREAPFKILDGIVDTDIYPAAVNFPFVLNDPKFEGFIPKGTPIAQVIPFKRDSWNMELGTKKDTQEILKFRDKLRSVFFDSYRNNFWNRKQFR